MKANASFQEILAEKMGVKTATSSSEVADAGPANLAFLLGRIKVFRFEKPVTNPFPRTAPPRRERVEGPAHLLSASQLEAKNWFLSRGERLADDLTRAELKTAFRRLALRLHPDAPGGSTQDFLDLKRNRQLLESLFTTESKPAAPGR